MFPVIKQMNIQTTEIFSLPTTEGGSVELEDDIGKKHVNGA